MDKVTNVYDYRGGKQVIKRKTFIVPPSKKEIYHENPYAEGSREHYLFSKITQRFGLYEQERGKNNTYDRFLNYVPRTIPRCTNCTEDTRRWSKLSPNERDEIKTGKNKRFAWICNKNCLWFDWFENIRSRY